MLHAFGENVQSFYMIGTIKLKSGIVVKIHELQCFQPHLHQQMF